MPRRIADHAAMKTPLTTLTEMTTIGWSMVLGNQPADPAADAARKAAAVQEWEDEGGKVKHVKTPRAKPARKAAKKRAPARIAKAKRRR